MGITILIPKMDNERLSRKSNFAFAFLDELFIFLIIEPWKILLLKKAKGTCIFCELVS